MARHGQRREQDEQSRHGREQEQQSWRAQGEGERDRRDAGRRDSGRQESWPSEDSGFSSERGRRGNGQGEMEDFAGRSGGPGSSRGHGQSSGSGWGPEQELGDGAYRGGRRSWEGEERGLYMDRQRDYRFVGQSGYGQGDSGQVGGWRPDEHGGSSRGSMSGWSRGGNQGWSDQGRGQFGRGDAQQGQGGPDRGEFGDQWGQGDYRQGRSDYGGMFGQSGGMGQGAHGQHPGGRFDGGMGGGQYVGRGPKGYRRSDERIQEDVSEQLTQHPDIDASEVEIKVQTGEVTLTGTVGSRQEKRMIEDLVEMASGVKEVNNQLRVKPRGATGTGSEMASSSDAQGNKSRT